MGTASSSPQPEQQRNRCVALRYVEQWERAVVSKQRKPIEKPSAAGLTAALAIAGALMAMLVLMILMDPARP